MKKIIVFFILACWSSALLAADNEQQNIINQQNQVIQNQKQIEREEEVQVELKQIAKDRAEESEKEEEFEQDDLSENDGKVVQNLRSIQCFRPHKIIFSANKLLTEDEQKLLSEKYLHRCFTLDWLAKFNKEITSFLVSKGYVASYATTEEEDFIKGTLQVKIVEGVLEKIIVDQDHLLDRAKLSAVFGFDKLPENGKVINIHDFDIAIERFNRLRSNKAAIKIVQGSAKNKSIVVIETHPKNTSKINLIYDNIGSKTTGENRDTIAFTQENLLHLNDSFTLSRTSNDLDRQNDRRYNSAINGNWSVPFGSNIFTFSGAKNSYSFLTGSDGSVLAQGFTETKSVAMESLLLKNKKYKSNSHLTFISRDNQVFTDYTRNETQSRKASIVNAAISTTFFLDSATLFLKPSYIKSVNVLNSRQDGAAVSKSSVHAEVEIFKFYANYNKKFTLPYLKSDASYNFVLDSQLSKNHLYSIDQISSGGFYSVRGFRQGSISGDSGYNMRNEITANLGKLILPQIGEKKDYFSYLNNFSLTPFYDYGHVQTRGIAREGRLSSAGFKIGFNKKTINASLTFAQSLSRSRMFTQNYDNGSVVYFDVSSELFFF